MDLYAATILITMLFLMITIADIMTNRLITKTTKYAAILASLLIAGAACGELVGVLTNGAPAALLVPHKIAKTAEFALAPLIGVLAAYAYGDPPKPRLAITVAVAHAVFEVIAACFGWVCSVDAQNIYHREELYAVYVVMFVLSIGYCSLSMIRDGLKYQVGLDAVLILILFFLAVGIGIQFLYSGIRIDFLCIAIANMLFYNRYYKITLQVDAVTGLLNRRCYDVNITDISSRAVIAFFDVDKFKQVNDTYGHSKGDVCLRKIAQLLRAAYGKNGACYRVGGDEFCVIVDNHPEKMDEMNRNFFEALAQLRQEDETMPGVSMGFALYDAASSHIRNAVEEADAMLYRHKNGEADGLGPCGRP